VKLCTRCKTPKSLDQFGTYKRYADGKNRVCRDCWTAYNAGRRIVRGIQPKLKLFERLWKSMQVCEHGIECPYCCWPWIKGRDKDGYGIITTTNAFKEHIGLRVSRVVWEIWHALPFPPDKEACHYCDWPPCANPSHLWPGTLAENRQDCVAKQRHSRGLNTGVHLHPEAFPRGVAHYRAKLTEQQISDIRMRHAAGEPSRKLGAAYDVSHFAILCIVRRRTWKHI
jgi:hypothetical protein